MPIDITTYQRVLPRPRLGRSLRGALVAGLVLVLSGCASFEITTPPEMVEVTSEYDRTFDYRATSMDGAVLGVRVLDEPAGEDVESPEQAFWVDAIKRNLRLHRGYALLEETDITSANGVSGALLKFGRDQGRDSYAYWIAIFRTDANLHLVDAGGQIEHFEQARPAIEKALASYVVNP